MKYWFTEGTHLAHANIIKYCNRPFLKDGDLTKDNRWVSKDIAMRRCAWMNKVIIDNWNRRVDPIDQVYHLGDFCFKNSPGGKEGEGMTIKATDWIRKLNGNIIFVKGNHDKNNSLRTLTERIVIRYGSHYVNLVHDPANYDPNFKINFVGHIHNKWKFKRVFDLMEDRYTDLINVGVDVWNFQPVTFEEIYKYYKRWSKTKSTKWQDDKEAVAKLKGII